MKAKNSLLIIGILLMAAGCLTQKLYEGSERPASEIATLVVVSEGEFRTVELDGKEVDVGSGWWLRITPGLHEVKVPRSGSALTFDAAAAQRYQLCVRWRSWDSIYKKWGIRNVKTDTWVAEEP